MSAVIQGIELLHIRLCNYDGHANNFTQRTNANYYSLVRDISR